MLRTGVYLITCTPTGKCYVGSASITFPRRWDNHRSELRRGVHPNRYLQRAWSKYGADAFRFEILERIEPERVIEAEQRWIDLLDPVFNAVRTAGHTRGHKMSDEQRAACAERMRGVRPTPETIEKRRQSRAGYRHSEETRAKMRASAGHRQSDEARRKMSAAKRAVGPKYLVAGELLTAKDISERYKLKYTTVHERVRRGVRGDALARRI